MALKVQTHSSKKNLFGAATIILAVMASSCTRSQGERDYEAAKNQLQGTNISEGLICVEHMIKLRPQSRFTMLAALEAANVCTKNKACEGHEESLLRYIAANSKDEKEIVKAQKRLCEVLYDKGIYKQAIDEMNRLLSMLDFKNGRNEIRLKLARSNFYIKNFYQAQIELKNYFKEAKTDDENFEGYLLQADIQADDKKFSDALQTYKRIQEKYRDLFFKNQVYMNEVLLLEEQKQLDQAILLLEDIKKDAGDPDLVEQKIDRLKEQKALQPGASGLHR